MQLVNVPLFEFKGLRETLDKTKSKDRPLQCVQSCVKAMNVGIQLQQQVHTGLYRHIILQFYEQNISNMPSVYCQKTMNY